MKTNTLQGIVIAGSMALACWSGSATAQDTAAVAAPLRPAEVYTCNYVDGKGPADLDRVVAGWNSWMDEDKTEAYSAWIMTPEYYGPGITFDVAWLGGWADGASMGRELDRWQRDGGKHAKAFTTVIKCDSHANFAAMVIRAPGGEFPGDGVAAFQDCKMKKGVTLDSVIAAYNRWAAYADSKGLNYGMWLYFPMYAGGNVEYDYKFVMGFPNHQAMGADWDNYVNKGGYEKGGEIFSGLESCDSARLYTAKLKRNGMPAAR